MQGYVLVVVVAVVLVAFIGPLLLAAAGLLRPRATQADAPRLALPWDWTLTLRSALVYTLAFNVTFFFQELFLVLPKALTPGLRPTLFHNNHHWDGTHPLAALFQGTGAVATLLSAGLCAWLLQRGSGRSLQARLFLLWMAYCGLFMALPQVAIGALSAGSDLGMAMDYLHMPPHVRLLCALLALAVLPPSALWLTRRLLELADAPDTVATAGARSAFVWRMATLPLLLGTVLILPFRVPREWIEVALLPAWVAVLGMGWMQAGAWRCRNVAVQPRAPGSMKLALAAVLALLLVFQAVLRPGIAFY